MFFLVRHRKLVVSDFLILFSRTFNKAVKARNTVIPMHRMGKRKRPRITGN